MLLNIKLSLLLHKLLHFHDLLLGVIYCSIAIQSTVTNSHISHYLVFIPCYMVRQERGIVNS